MQLDGKSVVYVEYLAAGSPATTPMPALQTGIVFKHWEMAIMRVGADTGSPAGREVLFLLLSASPLLLPLAPLQHREEMSRQYRTNVSIIPAASRASCDCESFK